VTRSPDALSPGQRGPIDHAIRDKLLSAAYDQFAHYGYDKASVSDLAQTAGWSTAYFYRFFESKQAIGEAISGQQFDAILVVAQEL